MQREFVKAQGNTVDNKLPVGDWRVYSAYALWEHEEDGEHYAYIKASPIGLIEQGKRLVPDDSDEEIYRPLGTPGLFIEFAQLFNQQPTLTAAPVFLDEAPPVVLDWVQRYGTLGICADYPMRDGGSIRGRFDYRESVMQFVRLSVEANRCLRLLGAVKAPGGPDAKTLRQLGMRGGTLEQLAKWAKRTVQETVNMHVESETCTRLYLRRDGTTFRGPGFHSLLGAMYIQMSNFLEAPEEEITFCRWCKDVVAFKGSEPLPSDAPKGARGKHKTHSNRKYCIEKFDIKDFCKNKWNYNRPDKAAQRS